MAEFHFLRPNLLWLLLLPIGAFLLTWSRGGLQSPWVSIVDAELLKALQKHSSSRFQSLFFVLLAFVWGGVMLSAAGPTWERQPRPTYLMKEAGVIVADLSTNMLVTDLKPDRFTREQFKLRDLLNEMKEQAVGLVAFAQEPYVVSPVTTDAATIQALIPELSPKIMPLQGDNIAAGLRKAQQLLEQSGNFKGFVILMTAGPVQSSDLSAANELGKSGYKLIVLSFGGATQGLMELARLGRGSVVEFAKDNRDIQQVMTALPHNQSLQKTDQQASEWWDLGRYALWFLLPWIALLYRRGWFEELVS